MSANVVIRPAVEGDLEALGALAGSLIRLHHTMDPARFFLPPDVEKGYRGWLHREIANPVAIVLVAVNDELPDPVVGYVYGRVEARDWNALLDRHAALHDIHVREDVRRRGVARRLLAEFHTVVRARDVPRVVLHTAMANERAQGLFKALGYRPTMIEMTCDEP